MTTAPAGPPRRSWARVSVRGAMLAVLISAALLGWQAQKRREQREAVEAVRAYGGWVHYDYEFVANKLTPGTGPRAPRRLRALLGDEPFQAVRMVSLVYDDTGGTRHDNSNAEPCVDLLAKLAKLPGLKELYLRDTQATDEGLAEIGKMTDLEVLYIWDGRAVTDGGIARLARLSKLKRVHLSGSGLTDEGLVMLSDLPAIEELSLQQNRVTDAGLAGLRGQGHLRQLCVGLGDIRVTDAGLAHLGGFRKLEMLDVQSARLTGDGLEALRALPALKEVWLSGTGVPDDAVQRLQAARPALKIRR